MAYPNKPSISALVPTGAIKIWGGENKSSTLIGDPGKKTTDTKTRAISFGSTDLDFIFLCDLLNPFIPLYPIRY